MPETELLKSLIPINALRAESFQQLLRRARIEQVPAHHAVFELGDADPENIYLLKGEMTLTPRNGAGRTIVGGGEDARYALAQLKPRQFAGVTTSEATIARVDAVLLDRMLTMDQAAGYEVAEFGAGDGEWVFRMVQHPSFERVPAANLSALFGRFTSVEMRAGQPIIRQGDPGDYYYIIRSGRVNVSGKSEKDGRTVMLSSLREGDGFGEEALVSGAPRNADVTAATAVTLMRLAKQDFDELLREPLVKWVSLPGAQGMAQAGAGIIDVRTEDEFGRGAIEGAVNLPLCALRIKARLLDPARRYVVCCQSGNRGAAAAFLLSQRGFDVHVLRGGLSAAALAGEAWSAHRG
jgi:CRP-like cAMP-binding protein